MVLLSDLPNYERFLCYEYSLSKKKVETKGKKIEFRFLSLIYKIVMFYDTAFYN